jgi:hypothetical protein
MGQTMDDEEFDRIENLIEQARARLARTSKYLPENLSGALAKVISRVDKFYDDVLDEAGIDEDEDEALDD